MRLGTLAWGFSLLAAWTVRAQSSSSTSTMSAKTRVRKVFVPGSAKGCHSPARAASSHCKRCHSETTIGAADAITFQVGSCGNVTTLAEFTETEIKLYAPLGLDGLVPASGDTLLLGGSVNIAGDLVVDGGSTHWGLETFYGEWCA